MSAIDEVYVNSNYPSVTAEQVNQYFLIQINLILISKQLFIVVRIVQLKFHVQTILSISQISIIV